MTNKSVWWCGWNVPNDIPEEHMAAAWPEGMRGWCTGHSEGYTTWVARVEAEAAEYATEVVIGCYGKSARRIDSRWEPKAKPDGWWPESGRFPR